MARRSGIITLFFAAFLAGTVDAAAPFGVKTDISTGATGARALAIGDLDGDGDLDPVVTATFLDTVFWYENDGANPPSFTERSVTNIPDGPGRVDLADVDRDGDLDVLVASYVDDTVAWYENIGTTPPSFVQRVIDQNANGATSAHHADVDGDGDLDVVATSYLADQVIWYENDGAALPGWTKRIAGAGADGAEYVYPADVDGDGELDLVSASSIDDTIRWHENSGTSPPTFTTRTISSSANHATMVRTGDLDGDGDLDVASSSFVDDRIVWYENDGGNPPAFTSHTVTAAANGAQAVRVEDVDRDGDLDLISASDLDGTIRWYENDGAADPIFTAHAVTTAVSGGEEALSADLDGDGDRDVISVSDNDATLAWYENRSIHRSAEFDGVSTVHPDYSGYFRVFDATDIDGDGDLDTIAGLAPVSRHLVVLENLGGSPPSWADHTLVDGLGQFWAAVGTDLDGDGDTDVVASGPDLVWFENDGTAPENWTERTIYPGFAGQAVNAGDINGDGTIDLVAGRVSSFETILLNDGASPPGWQYRAVFGGLGGTTLPLGDLDGDGDLDIGFTWPPQMGWARNDGGITSFTRIVVSNGQGILATDLGDLDGDGDLDMAAAAVGSGAMWFENDGASAPSFTGHVVEAGLDFSAMLAFDVDQDGDLDMVGMATDGLRWYENDGAADPQFTSRFVGPMSSSLGLGDFDGDGDVDVLTMDESPPFPAPLILRENCGAPFDLATLDSSSDYLLDGTEVVLFDFTVEHRGKAGDSPVELASIAVRFTDPSGTPLTTAEADDLILRAAIYRDDGSGQFEGGPDTAVGSFVSFNLVDGVQTVPFIDGDADVQIGFAQQAGRFFFVATMAPDASTASPDEFRFVHLEGDTVVEDAAFDLPLSGPCFEENESSLKRAVRDSDSDTVFDFEDCAPADPDVWFLPSEVTHVTIENFPGSSVLSWNVPDDLGGVSGVVYDVIKAQVPDDFVNQASCLESNGSDTTATDFGTPLPGTLTYYLVIAENSCGNGETGEDSTGNVRPAISCP